MKATRKFTYDTDKPTSSCLETMKQELRQALEQLETYRMTADLEIQKRRLVEQQLQLVTSQCEVLEKERIRLQQQLERALAKNIKLKAKTKSHQCEACAKNIDLEEALQSERASYLAEKNRVKAQIAEFIAQAQSPSVMNSIRKSEVETLQAKKQIAVVESELAQQKSLTTKLMKKLEQFEVQARSYLKGMTVVEGFLDDAIAQNALIKADQRNRPRKRAGSIKIYGRS